MEGNNNHMYSLQRAQFEFPSGLEQSSRVKTGTSTSGTSVHTKHILPQLNRLTPPQTQTDICRDMSWQSQTHKNRQHTHTHTPSRLDENTDFDYGEPAVWACVCINAFQFTEYLPLAMCESVASFCIYDFTCLCAHARVFKVCVCESNQL